MNDLESAKCLDFVLHLASEIVPASDSKPKYRIVWQLNDRLVLADALLYVGKEPQSFEVDKHWEVSQHSMYINSQKPLSKIREKFYDFFKTEEPFNRFESLYSNGSVLLDILLDFVNKLDLDVPATFDNQIYNAEFIDSGVKLPFINLSSEDNIKAVSLVETSDAKSSEN